MTLPFDDAKPIDLELNPPMDLALTSLEAAEALLKANGVNLDIVVGPQSLMAANWEWLDHEQMRRDTAQRLTPGGRMRADYTNFTPQMFPDELAKNPHDWCVIGLNGGRGNDGVYAITKVVRVFSRPGGEVR